MGAEAGSPPTVITASRCVSSRELSRSTAGLMNEVQKDGKVFAISRFGRIVAVLSPLPERLLLEFEDAAPAPVTEIEPAEPEVELGDLGELPRRLLVDASTSPTGHWTASPATARALGVKLLLAFEDLHAAGLATWETGHRIFITRRGRSVARALARRGVKGYEEGDAEYHPGP